MTAPVRGTAAALAAPPPNDWEPSMKKTLCFAAFSAGAMMTGTGIASSQEAPVPSAQPAALPHTIEAGETLSTIAQAKLGIPDRWTEIFELNRDALTDPEVIAVGQVIDVPAPPVAAAAVPALEEAPAPSDPSPAPPHTIVAGDNLSTISQARLGTPDRWVEIFVVNRHTLKSPDMLDVGQVLDIPSAPVAIPADVLASLAPAPAPEPVLSLRSATSSNGEVTPTRAVRSTGGGGGGGGNLAAIRACESSGDYGAVSASGQYRGAYQFDIPTWQSVGGSGDPAAASPAEQDARAGQLWSQRGSNPWPNCG